LVAYWFVVVALVAVKVVATRFVIVAAAEVNGLNETGREVARMLQRGWSKVAFVAVALVTLKLVNVLEAEVLVAEKYGAAIAPPDAMPATESVPGRQRARETEVAGERGRRRAGGTPPPTLPRSSRRRWTRP